MSGKECVECGLILSVWRDVDGDLRARDHHRDDCSIILKLRMSEQKLREQISETRYADDEVITYE